MSDGPVVTRFVIRIDRRTTTENGRRVALIRGTRPARRAPRRSS